VDRTRHYPYRISYQDKSAQRKQDCDPRRLLTTGEIVELESGVHVTITEVIRHPSPEGRVGEARGYRQRWREWAWRGPRTVLPLCCWLAGQLDQRARRPSSPLHSSKPHAGAWAPARTRARGDRRWASRGDL